MNLETEVESWLSSEAGFMVLSSGHETGHEKGFFLGVIKCSGRDCGKAGKILNIPKSAKLYILNGRIICVNYISIKLLVKQKKKESREFPLSSRQSKLWGWISRPSGLLWFRRNFLFQQLWSSFFKASFSRLVLRSSLPSTTTLCPQARQPCPWPLT